MIRMGSSLITTVQPVLVTNTSDKKKLHLEKNLFSKFQDKIKCQKISLYMKYNLTTLCIKM